MAIKITKDFVLGFLKKGSKFAGDLGCEIYDNTINQVAEKAFSEAIEIGIENTFAALYDANVPDEEIVRVVSVHWRISSQEAEKFLINEKREATIRALKQYLRLQGYTETEIKKFMREYMATTKIRNNRELWKLKNKPEKLVKAIQSKK